ncbi:MAG: DedA family protein [Leptospiraceae bacterium]|nr:DedA family protein [Leptospiraceae bacterium]MDW8307641.1 DedA family protein [Leptospiraceae bacterium]
MRILKALVAFFTDHGYWAVFTVLLACGFGLPIPEDISLVSGGVIAGLYPEKNNVHIMFGVGMAGVMLGDSIVFLLGWFFHERILKFKPIAAVVTPERYRKVQIYFARFGRWVVFMGRFMPGLRMPIFLSAGISRRVSFFLFFFTDFFAALISVPVWVYLGYYMAHNFDELMKILHRSQLMIFTVILLTGLMIFLFVFVKKRIKRKLNLEEI